MTETQEKALALVNEVREGRPYTIDEAKREYGWCFQAVCRAIERDEAEKAARAAEREQHEAFRQEVSDRIIRAQKWEPAAYENLRHYLDEFIIAKPDPLLEAMKDAWLKDNRDATDKQWRKDAEVFRAALAARGLKIVWEDK